MRYIMMHKNDPRSEAGEPPDMKLVEEMGAFIGGFAKQGKLVDGAGLLGSKARTRMTFRNGQATVKHGPYRGETELPAAMLVLKVQTRDEAVRWAERYGKILGDGEIELGKVTEPWDLGVMPAPPNPPLQIMLIEKADKESETGGRSPQKKAALTRLKTEMTEAGVFVKALRIKSSAEGKRLFFKDNNLRSLDGPFAESKELIGGFAVLDLSGMDEAISLAKRYAEILGGTLEMDIRPIDMSEA
ncbi:MAG: YciI family protein [Myxococcota bacterium]